MEKMQKFIYEPSIEILRGVKVNKDTKLSFENELPGLGVKVKQTIENLRMTLYSETNQDNKLIKTEMIVDLLNGDILVFDEKFGYKVPSYKLCTIEDGLETLKAQENLIKKNNEEK